MKHEELLHPEPALFLDRISSFQDALRQESLDGALILHNPNMFYYAGTVQNAFLWIPSEGEAALRVRKHLDKAIADSPVTDIQPFKSLKQIPELMASLLPSGHVRIGMEFDVVPVSEWRMWQELLPGAEWVDISPLIATQRSVKDYVEIQSIRAAGEIVVSTFMDAPNLYCPGMTDLELSATLVHEMRKKGHHGYIRTRGWRSEIYVGGTVSAGISSTVPWPFDGPVAIPSRYPAINSLTSDKTIEAHEPVLIDMLGGFNGYHYDFSRTFVFGRLDNELSEAHEVAVNIRDRVVESMRPGAVPRDLYLMALEIAEENGLGQAFMNHGLNQVKFIGHGIGLELDESPVLAKSFTEPLKKGNVIALEPKIIFPGKGGVGLEDTLVITDDSAEILVPCAPEIYKLST